MLYSIRILFLLLVTSFTAAHAQINHPASMADEIPTDTGELLVHPVLHGSLVLQWNGENIYIDPYGDPELYEEFGPPDLVLITHQHDDHFNLDTLTGLETSRAVFITPQVVADMVPPTLDGRQLIVLDNGENAEMSGIMINAVPMYNLPEEGARHVKGVGNGYVLRMGGRSIYISGDTEGIPEMRNLTAIDIAFVCMNLPYTMDVGQAADAVLDFSPTIVYPYHHRGQDIEEFKRLVDAGNQEIEVRLRDWYPEG